MRRKTNWLLAAVLAVGLGSGLAAVPARAGWGSALLKGLEKGAVKAEAKAATKAAEHAAEHAAAYQAEKAAMHEAGAMAHAPHEGGGAAHAAAEHEGTSASDVAEEVAGNLPGPDDGSGGGAPADDDGYDDTGRHYEDAKNAARLRTLADLEKVARDSKDGPLLAQVERIRAKESARHLAALRKLAHR